MTLNLYPPAVVGRELCQTFGILSYEKAILLANRKFVVLLRCLLVSEMIHRGAPEVFLHLESWKTAI
jgi:hypothetical protein